MLLEALNRQEKNGFVVADGPPRAQGPPRAEGPPRRGGAPRPLGDARRPPHGRDGEARALPRAQGADARAASRASGASASRVSSRTRSSRSTRSTPRRPSRSLEDAFRLDKTNAELAFYLGETTSTRARPSAPRSCCNTVLAREPRHFEALVYTGVLENEAGRTERALEAAQGGRRGQARRVPPVLRARRALRAPRDSSRAPRRS